MSKRSAGLERMRRTRVAIGPVTRRQQVAAVKQIKGMEIAEAVGEKIRAAVRDEVTEQLKTITATMFDCIDRVVECEAKQNAVLMRRVQDEGDCTVGQAGAETLEVLKIAEVAPDPIDKLESDRDCYEESDTQGG